MKEAALYEYSTLVDINVFDEKFRNTIILSKIKGSNMIKRLLLFLSPFLGFPFAFAHGKLPQELLEKAIGGDASSQSGLGLYYLQHGEKNKLSFGGKRQPSKTIQVRV